MYELPPDSPNVYRDLEWLESSLDNRPKSPVGALFDWLSRTSRELSFALFGEMEPRVWEYVDRTGQSWWMIQDSLADQPFRSLSINDVRVWLEQQYLASPDDV
ncbi:hypothetical protein [Phormidium tenue]|uniref:hypothetical protein n=1 Tax=Phormidium tenue TaxID=126344 RepID=UPI0011152650|nr:hypothetical protein [Phormidium tenue]MBD2230811.1 hypothetical protein [Phormidium tenue FACHB-1052]